MVNVIIYLEKKNEALELVSDLLAARLIGHASIDTENNSYRQENGKVLHEVNSVITAQTKSLLFSQIETFVIEKYGSHVPIYSLPITQSNSTFDAIIRQSTLKI
jgi:uncharacterized protein involved in tolerance to divalent cations